MKTLNESFTDQEFAQLKCRKEKMNLNWHDFIMCLADKYSKLAYPRPKITDEMLKDSQFETEEVTE